MITFKDKASGISFHIWNMEVKSWLHLDRLYIISNHKAAQFSMT